ncbi:unnamed protein product [Mucor hiemalis]
MNKHKRSIQRREHSPNTNEEVQETRVDGPIVRTFLRIIRLFSFQFYLIYWTLSKICMMLFAYSKLLVTRVLIIPILSILGAIHDIGLRFRPRSYLSLFKLLFFAIILFLLKEKYTQPQSQGLSATASFLLADDIHTTENEFQTVQIINFNSLGRVLEVIKIMDEGNRKVWEKVSDEAKEVKRTIDIVKMYFEEKINGLWGRIEEQQSQIENVEKEVFSELGRRHSEFETEQGKRLLIIQKNLYKDIEDTVKEYLQSAGIVVSDIEGEDEALSIQNIVESITTNLIAKEAVPDSKYLEEMIDKCIQKYHQDVLNSADFALMQRGAYILHSKTSSTFHSSSVWKRAMLMLIGFTLSPSTTPEMAISPGNQVNDCWSMYGHEGTLGISLSEPIYIHGITVEHPSREILLDQIKNAPREIEVYGIYVSPTGKGKEQALLGSIIYNIDSSHTVLPIQTFDLRKKGTLDGNVYVAVQLKILSNWGNPEQTDIYRVRIHGVPPSIKQID